MWMRNKGITYVGILFPSILILSVGTTVTHLLAEEVGVCYQLQQKGSLVCNFPFQKLLKKIIRTLENVALLLNKIGYREWPKNEVAFINGCSAARETRSFSGFPLSA